MIGGTWRMVVALVLLVATGCGGDGAGPAAAPETTTTTAPEPLTPLAPGRYTYAVKGALSGNVLRPQPLVPTATVTVDPANGRDQRQVLTFGEVVVDTVARYGDDGVYLVAMKANEAGGGDEYRPPEPVLTLPTGARTGRAWSWQIVSTDGGSTMKADYKVVNTELRKVGNESIVTSVIEATTVVTGDGILTSRQTLWMSERHGGLPVRMAELTEGSNQGLDIRLEGTFDLVSTTPSP